MNVLAPVGPVPVFAPAEFRLRPDRPTGGNPYRDVEVEAEFVRPGGAVDRVAGFADADDGAVFAVRHLPQTPGAHRWTVRWRWPDGADEAAGVYEAAVSDHPGIVRADGWGFRWSGSGGRFVWNATTAYLMPGLAEAVRDAALDRLAAAGVNRIRVAVSPARQPDGSRWSEPAVRERPDFTFLYSPWPAARPHDVHDPGHDPSRFQAKFWQGLDRLFRAADARGILVQAVLFLDGAEPGNYPFDRSRTDDPDEEAYFRYAAARLAAHPNLEWCVTNEWANFRPDAWVESRGALLASLDPYGHLVSVHGHGHFPFRASPWCTHALFQVWDEHGEAAWAEAERARMLAEAGRPKPIVNDENGYEDSYPAGYGEARTAPARDAESRVRLAWDLAFGGAWSTAGESAADGAGGWINGWRPGPSAMLAGLGRLRRFLEAVPEWETLEADPAAVSGWARCRSRPGEVYAVYRYAGGSTVVKLPDPEGWDVDVFEPATGEWTAVARSAQLMRDPYAGPGWVAPALPWGATQAVVVRRAARD